MSDDIVVVDNGSTYETQESAIVAKNEADRSEQWAKYAEEKANLADERAVDAAESSDAAAQAATAAIEAKQYAETAITDENLIIVATDLKSDPSNIKKTAGSIDNVNKVSNDIENINAVAANKANIDKVAADKDNIDTVATNIVNVNTVAKNIDNVNILAPHTEAMETIAPDIMDVVTVAGIAEQTKNVSDNMAHVVAVDNNKTNIDKAVANEANITTVATNINNVNTVALDKANIDAVAANKDNIDTVSANIAEVKNVSDNMIDVKNAVQSAADAQKWAIGTVAERPEGSSKYWAEQAKSVAQISDASESVKGIVRLATDAEAKAGLDNETAITPKKLQDNLSNNVGRINQLGFNGTLESGVITFTPDQGTYELKAGYEYEIDLLFAAVGSIPDTTQLKIVNGDDTINIVNVLDSDYSQPTTYGAMKQVCRYDTEIGWRWIFNVRYSIASDGSKVFVMPATTVDTSDKIEKSSIAQDLSTPSADTVPSTTAVSNESSRIISIMNNKVSKSGDTMTGDLTINQNDLFLVKNSGAIAVYKNATRESGTIPSTPGGYGFNLFWDKNNVEVGRLESWQHEDGNNHILIRAIRGNVSANLTVGIGANNEIYTVAPACAFNDSIVTTVSHDSNYVRFGNGIQICFGNSAVNQTITFQQPFKDAGYKVGFCQTENAEHNINNTAVNKTTTSFNFNRGYTGDWIAIGYWY